MRISRTDRSLLARWWFTVDHTLLAALLVLIGLGVVLTLAASPAVALKKGLPAFHFVERQVVFATLGVLVMLAVSMLDHRQLRRLALVLSAGCLVAMVAVLFTGAEINGARRWLRIAGLSLQPSEFAKPAFAVITAWAFAESERRKDMPALPIAVGLYVVFATLLVLQPDVGQTLLVSLVWAVLFLLSGRPIAWVGGFSGIGAGAMVAAYFSFPHVKSRIDRFLHGTDSDFSQTERALQSFVEGGFMGRGPGEGTIKTQLPDAHTDFIFAVVAEEYGILACLALLALFAVIVLRALARTVGEPDPFVRNAVSALALMIGLQALINMGVNVGLLPAKGMTLPFVSAGGSSTLAMAVTCGMLLSLTRRRADPARLKMPGLPVTVDELQSVGTRPS
jgi:cell division protein FtsW